MERGGSRFPCRWARQPPERSGRPAVGRGPRVAGRHRRRGWRVAEVTVVTARSRRIGTAREAHSIVTLRWRPLAFRS
ncbi:hypothetical protein HRbin40_01687 [bacterium HR40]|nr:hypothetical protein HRbin40_01687 [bacterium HR40]